MIKYHSQNYNPLTTKHVVSYVSMIKNDTPMERFPKFL